MPTLALGDGEHETVTLVRGKEVEETGVAGLLRTSKMVFMGPMGSWSPRPSQSMFGRLPFESPDSPLKPGGGGRDPISLLPR